MTEIIFKKGSTYTVCLSVGYPSMIIDITEKKTVTSLSSELNTETLSKVNQLRTRKYSSIIPILP